MSYFSIFFVNSDETNIMSFAKDEIIDFSPDKELLKINPEIRKYNL